MIDDPGRSGYYEIAPGRSGDRGAPRGCRGKSALHRARCRVTPGMPQGVGSGHRNIPLLSPRTGVRVKRRCKRPPAHAAMRRPGNPHREQGQAGTRFPSGNGRRPVFSLIGGRVPGRLHERAGDGTPREMVAHPPFGEVDRTRLIGRPGALLCCALKIASRFSKHNISSYQVDRHYRSVITRLRHSPLRAGRPGALIFIELLKSLRDFNNSIKK